MTRFHLMLTRVVILWRYDFRIYQHECSKTVVRHRYDDGYYDIIVQFKRMEMEIY